MLYAVLGALLEKAAAVLRSPVVEAPGEHGALQRRRVAAFVGRVGRMWPAVLPALQRQNAVLAGAAAAASAALHAAGASPSEPVPALPAAHGDPVEAHVRLLGELDGLVVQLHRAGGEPWAADARRALRRSLAEAAAIEAGLVEGSTPAPGGPGAGSAR